MQCLYRSAVSLIVVSVSVVLPVRPAAAQNQTPGQITKFDSSSGEKHCDDTTRTGEQARHERERCELRVVDSVIAQDSNGNIGIGTTTPAAKLDVADGNLNLDDSSIASGNILKSGVLFLHSFGTENTFIGSNAGNLTFQGSGNTAIGYEALENLESAGSNTAIGAEALESNTGGSFNTAIGTIALRNHRFGDNNIAIGEASDFGNQFGRGNTVVGNVTFRNNQAGVNNTGIGFLTDVYAPELVNATAIGFAAVVNASNKIRLGNTQVSVIEGQVPYTFTSDRNQKENFQAVDGEQVLRKLGGFNISSWNYIGHDPQQFRHYGPVAQEFFSAFGHDGVGTIGTPTTINSGDLEGILMIAVQALEKQNAALQTRIDALERAIREMRVGASHSVK